MVFKKMLKLLFFLTALTSLLTAFSTTPCNLRASDTCNKHCQETTVKLSPKMNYYYGCQDISFCEFSIGNLQKRKYQCLSPPIGHSVKYCKWVNGKCVPNGSAPPTISPPPTYDPWLCNDGCFAAKDGICDDGGPGSKDGLCPFGSDCTDCGPR